MNKRFTIAVAALTGFIAAMMPVRAQQPVQFLPTNNGFWVTPANWEDYGSGQNVPEGQFLEIAVIGSGGTAIVNSTFNETSSPQGPGELDITNGRVQILDGAELTMGPDGSGVGTVNRSIDVVDRLSIVGTGTLGGASINFAPTATLDIEFSASTSSPISVTGLATVGGTLNLDFSSLVNPSGSRTLITAGTASGAFSSINAVGLGPAQTARVTASAGLVEATVLDILTMTVDRETGAVSINNPHTHGVSLDGYSIRSAAGSLNPAGLAGLGGGWTTAASNSSTAVAQLFEGTLGSPSASIAAGATPTISTGTGMFVPGTPTEFLQDVEDLVFEYTDASFISPIRGTVTYVGGQKVHNNIVLTIDDGGNAALLNTSIFPQEVEAYRILSDSSPLQTATWDSFEDQNIDDGTWGVSAQSGTGMLLELQEDGTTTFNQSTLYNIGQILNSGFTPAGITFEFLLAGDTEFTQGVVVFDDLPSVGTPGDFDNDGDVDGRDFLRWQRGQSPNPLSQSDLADWRSNYGSQSSLSAIAAVPEPATASLWAVFVCCCLGLREVRKHAGSLVS